MSIRTSNDHIRNKLHKVASSLQAIQRRLGRSHYASKNVVKGKKCPPAKSALVVSEYLKESCGKILTDVTPNPTVDEVISSNQSNMSVEKLLKKSSRSRSLSESGHKSEIDIEDFPSCQRRQSDVYDSNKSINSIFRLHQTLNSVARTRNNSGSTTNIQEKSYSSVKIYPLFQSKDYSNKAIRPTSLFISQRNAVQNFAKPDKHFQNPVKKVKQSTQSLDNYLSNMSNDQTKKFRSEKAAEAIDSCILLMMNLINES